MSDMLLLAVGRSISLTPGTRKAVFGFQIDRFLFDGEVWNLMGFFEGDALLVAQWAGEQVPSSRGVIRVTAEPLDSPLYLPMVFVPRTNPGFVMLNNQGKVGLLLQATPGCLMVESFDGANHGTLFLDAR